MGHLKTKGVLILQEILRLQIKIIPELIDILEKRYSILRTIYFNQPIGRRILANKLQLGERIIRTEIGFLKDQNLIDINASGMTMTKDGEEIIEKLKEYMLQIKGITNIEANLKESLKVSKVIVVPGNIEEDGSVLKELAKAAATFLKDVIKENDIIALTGGTTIKEVVDSFPKVTQFSNILVVPSRGGMGRKVETQANTLASILANKLNGNYKMLHIPDNISQEVMESLMKEKEIKDAVETIHKANILIYGIGNAEHMARKRGISEEKVKELISLGAVAEAYGCYFNINGEVIYSTPTLGISLNDTDKIDVHLAVAGGKNKAKAILSSCKNNHKAVIVTDESAGREIIKLLEEKNESNE